MEKKIICQTPPPEKRPTCYNVAWEAFTKSGVEKQMNEMKTKLEIKEVYMDGKSLKSFWSLLT